MVAELITSGLDVNLANEQNILPIHIAIIKKHVSIVHQLLTAGVCPNARLPNGLPILLAAAQVGSIEILRLLLESGADPELHDHDGETAFTWAIETEQEEMVHLLRMARERSSNAE